MEQYCFISFLLLPPYLLGCSDTAPGRYLPILSVSNPTKWIISSSGNALRQDPLFQPHSDRKNRKLDTHP
uniref:Uncharacterized protein n=1 Tax=Picea glauca TaxID=3330 RepID=A0A101LYI2_PICGL|nr:hypothetical protein ABT39_MTgene5906 [Picea glauca]QHR92064.1 hypothetical protein Q903MT_gene6100 [Picea sitchensis]